MSQVSKTFEEGLDSLFKRYDSLERWKNTKPVAYKLFREDVTAAHRAEMDRVVEEIVKVRTINHAGCSINGKHHDPQCAREMKHQERQSARYKAIKEVPFINHEWLKIPAGLRPMKDNGYPDLREHK